MSDAVKYMSSAMVEKFGDRAHAVAFEQVCVSGCSANAASWNAIAAKITEITQAKDERR